MCSRAREMRCWLAICGCDGGALAGRAFDALMDLSFSARKIFFCLIIIHHERTKMLTGVVVTGLGPASRVLATLALARRRVAEQGQAGHAHDSPLVR